MDSILDCNEMISAPAPTLRNNIARQRPVPRQHSYHPAQVRNHPILAPQDLNSEPLNASQKPGKSEPQNLTPIKRVSELDLKVFTAKDDHDIIFAARNSNKVSMSLICKQQAIKLSKSVGAIRERINKILRELSETDYLKLKEIIKVHLKTPLTPRLTHLESQFTKNWKTEE